MREATTIVFNEADTFEEVVVVVRYDSTRVSLALSRKTGGDIEAVMEKDNARNLIEALKIALA